MIKLFRELRKENFAANSITKYLLYAIGEIILVVIGILIALSFNNWNEKEKEYERSLHYHNRLLEDINLVIENSQRVSEISDRTLRSISSTVKLLEDGGRLDSADKEIIDFALIWLSRTNFRTPEIPTLDEMKSSGELSLIYDEDLRELLLRFNNFLGQVESVIEKISVAIEPDYEIYNRYVRTYVDPESLTVTHQYDFDKMKLDEELINTFSRSAYHWRGYTYFMQAVVEDANKVAAELQKKKDLMETSRK